MRKLYTYSLEQSPKTELVKEERLYYLRSATFNPPSLHFCHLCTRILLTFPNSHKVFQFSRILNPSHTAAELSKLAKLTISKFLQSLSVHAKSENIFAELKLSLCNQTCNRNAHKVFQSKQVLQDRYLAKVSTFANFLLNSLEIP